VPTTTLSSKGQVIIPKDVRDAHGWDAGTLFDVEATPEGVLLRPRVGTSRKPINVDDVFGCLKYAGPALTLDEMNDVVAAEAKRRMKRWQR